ncbi:MAG TPA: lysylphosphatidylglycerol synthase transmembrane domain-containing protein [Dehalococcoidia bacterium]|nr:lysylphosphatidylglycerol synthase transmembrane domain-containing protein [Dehalococcoidia bacterium]
MTIGQASGVNAGQRRGLALRLLPWALRLVVTAGLAALIVLRVDLSEMAQAWQGFDLRWLTPALLVTASVRLLDAVRWRLYLSKYGEAPFSGLLGAFLIGNLGNTLLPFRAGDLAKVQILANRYRIPRAALTSSTFILESVTDGVTFSLLLLASLPFLDVPAVPDALLLAFASLGLGGFVIVTLLSRTLPADLFDQAWPRRLIATDLREWLHRQWPAFLDGLETLRRRRLWGPVLVLNTVGWTVQAISFWMFGLAFDLDLSFSNYLVVMVTANLVGAIPITFFNFGTYEAAVLELVAAWGVARDEALAFALATHLLTNLLIIALGIAAAAVMRVQIREIFRLRD